MLILMYLIIVGIMLPVAIYLFDAIGTQYVAQSKAIKVRRKEKRGEYPAYSEWQSHPVERTMFTIIFWVLGFWTSFYVFGLLYALPLTYCYGALPWVYYYHLRKEWETCYMRYSSGVYGDNGGTGCISVLFRVIVNLLKPLYWFVFALIFYIKDFISDVKGMC